MLSKAVYLYTNILSLWTAFIISKAGMSIPASFYCIFPFHATTITGSNYCFPIVEFNLLSHGLLILLLHHCFLPQSICESVFSFQSLNAGPIAGLFSSNNPFICSFSRFQRYFCGDILSSFFVFVNTYFVVCGNFSVFLVDFADGHLMDNLPAMASFRASQYIIFFEQICFLYHFISTIMAIFSSIYILIFLNVSFGIHSAPKTFAENSGMFLSPTFLKNLCIKKAAVCWTQAAAF